jgi:predicted ATPase
VGREREVGEVRALLDGGARLVTLTGPGGSGKTRLAIEVAAGLVGELRNGVFWVDLAPLTDPALVLETAANALGAREELAAHIADRELLLVLDNFEQVADAAPRLAQLLERCPNLRLMVTSRELLRIRGEREYEVDPLARSEAIHLFYARSGLDPGPAVAELCRRLDHLPLAVELAAARTRALTPEQIVERLGRRLDLFTGGRDAEPRQRTLRATIEWSHALLDAEERLLFRRLAVFAGGWELEAAEEVADAEFDGLQSLVEKSLVRREGARFSMLGTIREYASERLEESEEAGELRDRHARWFLALAEEAAPLLLAYAQEWLDRLEAEHDNLRAGLDWLTRTGDVQTALRLAGALPRFWDEKGHLAEGRRRLEALLAIDPRPTAARASALNAASDMAVSLGDPAAARVRAEEALDLHRTLGDAHGVAASEFLLGLALADGGDHVAARDLFETSSRGFEALGDHHYELVVSRMHAWMSYRLGDRERGRALHERNLERARAAGNRHLEASTRDALAMIALDEDRVADAVGLLTEGHLPGRDAGDAQGVARTVSRAARALAAAGRAGAAAELLAGAEVLHEISGATVRPWLAEMNERTLAAIREKLDDEALAAAWERGRALAPEEAVALAQRELQRGLRSPA